MKDETRKRITIVWLIGSIALIVVWLPLLMRSIAFGI